MPVSGKIMGLGSGEFDLQRARQYYRGLLEAVVDPATVVGALQEGVEGLQIIDVRDCDSYLCGHLPGAVNLNVDELPQALDGLDPDQETLVYSYGPYCLLASHAAMILLDHGFRVKSMFGGFEGYMSNFGPIELGGQGVAPLSSA